MLRRRLAEPPVRRRPAREGPTRTIPLAVVLRDHRPAVVRIVLASVAIAPAALVYVFGLAYGSAAIGLSRPGLLSLVALASLVMIVTQPLFGLLSDRIGRRPVFVTGVVGSAVTVPLWLHSLHGGDWSGIFAFGLVLMGVFVAMSSGVLLATFLEMFPADVRFSGMAVSFTVGIVVTGFIPAITQSMVQSDPAAWPSIAWLFGALMLVAGLAVASAPETFRTPTAALGLPRSATSAAPDRGTGRSIPGPSEEAPVNDHPGVRP